MSLEEHLRAFWLSRTENLYTFIWWGILVLLELQFASIASLLFGFVVHIESYLIGACIALAFVLSGTVFSIPRKHRKELTMADS